MSEHTRLGVPAFRKRMILLPVLCALGSPPALAADSAYTSLDLDRCVLDPPDPRDPLQSGVWHCEGYAGIPVLVTEGDLRFMISYGPRAADELAATETWPAFNSIGETLEWRLDASGRPFATILRYFTQESNGSQGQILVITRIGAPGGVCHVAYVNALANPDANNLARQAADQLAPSFRCGVDQALPFGNPGE